MGREWSCEAGERQTVCQSPRVSAPTHHKLGGLEQENFVVSQSQDQQSKSQGVCKSMLPLKVKGKE